MQISKLGYVNDKKKVIEKLLYGSNKTLENMKKKTIPSHNTPWSKYHKIDEEKQEKDEKTNKKEQEKDKDEKKEIDTNQLIEEMRRWGC